MRAPTNRRPAGTYDGPREPSRPQPKPVTVEDLCKTEHFHNRLAEARIKRKKALAARLAAAEKIPHRRFTPIVTEAANDGGDEMHMAETPAEKTISAGPPPLFLHRPPPSRARAEQDLPVKHADLRAFASSVAPMAPPIPSEIELSEDAAARQRLGAAMALSSLPERPLEPALVPMVSAATIAGLRLQHVVPALLALGAVMLAGWIAPRSGNEASDGATAVAQATEAAPRAVSEQPLATAGLATPEVMTVALGMTAIPASNVDAAPNALDGVPRANLAQIEASSDFAAPGPLALAPNIDAREIPGPADDAALTLAAQRVPELSDPDAISSPRPMLRPETALAVATGVTEGVGLAAPINIALRLSDGAGADGSGEAASDTIQARATRSESLLKGGQSGASAARPLIMHIPSGAAQNQQANYVARVNTLVTPHVEPRAVPFDISYSHVRVYHAEDMPAAIKMAALLDIRLLDKTSFEPRPSPGLIEIWWQGAVSTDVPVTRTARALPQVLDEAQVALETSNASVSPADRSTLPTRSAWIPAARLSPRAAAGANGELPTAGGASQPGGAEPVVLNADQSKGLRRLFRGLGVSKRTGLEQLDQDAEG